MAGVSFGVFILVNRQRGNAIRTARNRHRHTILLIGSVRFYHPFSFLEPGGRSLFAFQNHLKTEKAAPQDCFLYGNINFSRDFTSKVTTFQGTFPADSRFSLSFIWCSMSILRTEQEIRYVHCLDSLIVPTGKFVCCENKFGVIIRYFKQAAIFSLFCLFRVDLLRHLNIDFFVLSDCYKINLAISGFPTLTVYPRRQSSKYTIFSRLEATLSAL